MPEPNVGLLIGIGAGISVPRFGFFAGDKGLSGSIFLYVDASVESGAGVGVGVGFDSDGVCVSLSARSRSCPATNSAASSRHAIMPKYLKVDCNPDVVLKFMA